MKTAYEIGDDAWIYVGNHQGELTKGTVVHKFTLPHWPPDIVHYVIEIPTSIDPLLEVCDPMTMASRPEGPIGLWEMVSKDIPWIVTVPVKEAEIDESPDE